MWNATYHQALHLYLVLPWNYPTTENIQIKSYNTIFNLIVFIRVIIHHWLKYFRNWTFQLLWFLIHKSNRHVSFTWVKLQMLVFIEQKSLPTSFYPKKIWQKISNPLKSANPYFQTPPKKSSHLPLTNIPECLPPTPLSRVGVQIQANSNKLLSALNYWLVSCEIFNQRANFSTIAALIPGMMNQRNKSIPLQNRWPINRYKFVFF